MNTQQALTKRLFYGTITTFSAFSLLQAIPRLYQPIQRPAYLPAIQLRQLWLIMPARLKARQEQLTQ